MKRYKLYSVIILTTLTSYNCFKFTMFNINPYVEHNCCISKKLPAMGVVTGMGTGFQFNIFDDGKPKIHWDVVLGTKGTRTIERIYDTEIANSIFRNYSNEPENAWLSILIKSQRIRYESGWGFTLFLPLIGFPQMIARCNLEIEAALFKAGNETPVVSYAVTGKGWKAKKPYQLEGSNFSYYTCNEAYRNGLLSIRSKMTRDAKKINGLIQ